MEADVQNISAWKSVLGACGTVLLVIWGTAWKVSSRVTKMEASLEKVSDKTKSLEASKEELELKLQSYEDRCPRLQKELTETLSIALETSFKGMLSDLILTHTKELADINKNLALMAQSQANLNDKVDGIHTKVERNYCTLQGPMDTGKRRRYSDFEAETTRGDG